MKKIELSGKLGKNKFFLIDNEDFAWISKIRWHLSPAGYPRTTTYDSETKKTKPIILHKIIMGDSSGYYVDHINRNKLDNRKKNLRWCTPSQNRINSKIRKDSYSKEKGVYFSKDRNKWCAYIQVDGKNKGLGNFYNKEDAIRVREKASKKHFRDFDFTYQ